MFWDSRSFKKGRADVSYRFWFACSATQAVSCYVSWWLCNN